MNLLSEKILDELALKFLKIKGLKCCCGKAFCSFEGEGYTTGFYIKCTNDPVCASCSRVVTNKWIVTTRKEWEAERIYKLGLHDF